MVEAEARGALRRLGAWLQQRERQVAEAHARRALTADEVPFSPSRPHPWPPPHRLFGGGGGYRSHLPLPNSQMNPARTVPRLGTVLEWWLEGGERRHRDFPHGPLAAARPRAPGGGVGPDRSRPHRQGGAPPRPGPPAAESPPPQRLVTSGCLTVRPDTHAQATVLTIEHARLSTRTQSTNQLCNMDLSCF